MSLTLKFLGGATLTGVSADIYTVPASKVTRLEHLIISNGATQGTVTVNFYDSSGTTNYALINGTAIGANETIEMANLILESGDKIRALAGTTAGAVVTLFGVEQDVS